jgi:hypothetical protein
MGGKLALLSFGWSRSHLFIDRLRFRIRVDYVQVGCIDEVHLDDACVAAPNNFHRIMAG